jgi:transcriptional regulator with XRE-family HTH domain
LLVTALASRRPTTVRQTNTRTKTARRFFIGLAAASRMIRAEAGLSQREVARRGGVSERLVSDVENERANPTATCLDRLAKGLGLGGVGELATLADESAGRLAASVVRHTD